MRTNRAKTRAMRERGTITCSELEDPKEPDQPAVAPSRFLPAARPTHPGHWASPPEAWSASAEDAVVGREMMGVLQRELDRLPPGQRVVVALRDEHGWPAAEVCHVLGLIEANQPVLFHLSRTRLPGPLPASVP